MEAAAGFLENLCTPDVQFIAKETDIHLISNVL